MELRLVVLLSAVLLVSGCSQSLPDDASEGFEQLADNRHDSNYHVSYEISVGSGSSGEVSTEVDLYSYEGVTKVVGTPPSTYDSGTTAVYYLDNRTVSCTESRQGVSCSKGDSHDIFSLVSVAEFEDLNYSGSDSFAERNCKMFTGVPNTSSINPSNYQELESRVCLDRGLGFLSYMEINASTAYTDSQATIEAVEFDKDVGEENVELPKAFLASSQCTSVPEVEITPLESFDSAVISVNGENRSVSLGDRFESMKFELSESNLEDGTNDVYVYAGDSKVTTNCYYFDFSQRDEYDYEPYPSYGTAEESDLDLSQFTVFGDRIQNGDFSDAEMVGDEEVDITGWSHQDGTTGHLRTRENAIDGQSIGTGWKQNGLGDEASISQEVNLTGVEAVGLDVKGTSGNPQRSKIVLIVDGEEQGFFIKRPQREELYRDLGVELERDFSGVHTVRIKWIQIQGDNLGNSIIDNVRAYR